MIVGKLIAAAVGGACAGFLVGYSLYNVPGGVGWSVSNWVSYNSGNVAIYTLGGMMIAVSLAFVFQRKL